MYIYFRQTNNLFIAFNLRFEKIKDEGVNMPMGEHSLHESVFKSVFDK